MQPNLDKFSLTDKIKRKKMEMTDHEITSCIIISHFNNATDYWGRGFTLYYYAAVKQIQN